MATKGRLNVHGAFISPMCKPQELTFLDCVAGHAAGGRGEHARRKLNTIR